MRHKVNKYRRLRGKTFPAGICRTFPNLTFSLPGKKANIPSSLDVAIVTDQLLPANHSRKEKRKKKMETVCRPKDKRNVEAQYLLAETMRLKIL